MTQNTLKLGVAVFAALGSLLLAVRPGEARMLAVSRLLRPLLPMQWRPSRAERIADALVDAALNPPDGVSVVDAGQLA